jgi:hypothetical protein
VCDAGPWNQDLRREKFNIYRFAAYKEDVIDLVGRVCAVSVQTMSILAQMPG